MNMDMITSITDDPSTGEATITLSERGRAVFADLLNMVRIPDSARDPIEQYEHDSARELLEELQRLA